MVYLLYCIYNAFKSVTSRETLNEDSRNCFVAVVVVVPALQPVPSSFFTLFALGYTTHIDVYICSDEK